MPTLAELTEKLAKQEEYLKSLREKIELTKAQDELVATIQSAYGAIEKAIMDTITEKKIPIKALDGKFISLKVSEMGNLNVSLVSEASKAKASNGNGNGTPSSNGNGNGNGSKESSSDKYEYFLQDGRGPFAGVQKALDALNVDANQRPKHDRWNRLSKDWQKKIERREKAVVPATEAPVPEKETVSVN